MKRIFTMAILSGLLAAGSIAEGQYSLSVSGPTTREINSNFQLAVQFSSVGGSAVAGWSYGLCHEAAFFDITGVTNGSTTQTVKNGAPPDFNNTNVIPGGGFTVGVVICFTGCAVLPPGSGYQLNVATYHAGGAEGTGDVGFCNTLGLPPVATVVVVGGSSVTPAQSGTSVEIVAPPPPGFTYFAPTGSANFDATSGLGAFTAQVSILEDAANAGFPNSTQGFSMGLQHDASILAITDGPDPVLPFSPDFIGPAVHPSGWTIGVVYSFTGQNALDFPTATPVIEIDYAISGLAGSPATSTPLSWTDALGAPPVANVVVVGGQSLDATFVDGSMQLNPITDTPFLRGDCNTDLKINIADGIFILNDLFLGGPDGLCAAACDANANGQQEMIDAIFLIQYQLLSGPAPAAPFPTCGIDPGAPCDASACP